MKIYVKAKDMEFMVKVKSPTKQDLDKIDGPDYEGQVSPFQVYTDRVLDEIGKILHEPEVGYCYKVK